MIADRGPVRLHPPRGDLQVPHLLLGVPAQAAGGRRQEAGAGTQQAGHGAAARRGQRSDADTRYQQIFVHTSTRYLHIVNI